MKEDSEKRGKIREIVERITYRDYSEGDMFTRKIEPEQLASFLLEILDKLEDYKNSK